MWTTALSSTATCGWTPPSGTRIVLTTGSSPASTTCAPPAERRTTIAQRRILHLNIIVIRHFPFGLSLKLISTRDAHYLTIPPSNGTKNHATRHGRNRGGLRRALLKRPPAAVVR